MGAGASSSERRVHVQQARKSGVQEAEIRDYCRLNDISLPAEAAASKALPEEDLQSQLVEMGFHADAACVALLNEESLEGAIQWLCEHPEVGAENRTPTRGDELAAAASGLLALETVDADLLTWARAVVALQKDAPEDPSAKKKKKKEKRRSRLEKDYDEKRRRIEGALKSGEKPSDWTSAIRGVDDARKKRERPSDDEEKQAEKLESLLRKADDANEDAKSRRDDVTQFCRAAEPNISTTTLEKVYLYLKEKVHNNQSLKEKEVKESIFGTLDIVEATGAGLVPKLLELILIEEDELLFKKLIQQPFTPADDLPTGYYAPSSGQHETPPLREGKKNLTQDDTAEDLTENHAKARTVLCDRLRQRREAEVGESGLHETFDAAAKSELAALDRRFAADGSTLLRDASEAQAAMRGRLAVERDAARASLLAHLEVRRKKKRQDLLEEEGHDGEETVAAMEAFEATLKAGASAFDESFAADASRLLASAAEAEAKARARVKGDRAQAKEALEARLRNQRELRRRELVKQGLKGPKLDAALEDYDKVKTRDELASFDRKADADGDRIVAGAVESYAALVAKVAAQRATARSALEDRLLQRRRRRRPEEAMSTSTDDEEEVADFVQQFDALEAAALAGLDLLDTMSSQKESCAEAARRLCGKHAALERSVKESLEASRESARAALQARLARATTKDSNAESHLAELDRRFDALAAESAIGVERLIDAVAGNEKDETKAAAAINVSATALLERQAANFLDLEGRFAVERSRRGLELRARINAKAARVSSHEEDDDDVSRAAEVFRGWADLDRSANSDELEALNLAHARFAGEAVGWSTAAGKVFDAAATASLLEGHEAALQDLSDRLAAQGARRRAALASRLTKSESHAALAALDEDLHRDRWMALNDLVANQREALLAALEVRKLAGATRGTADLATDLHASYRAVAGRSAGAFRVVMDGVRDGLRTVREEETLLQDNTSKKEKSLSSSSSSESSSPSSSFISDEKKKKARAAAAALIHEHAVHQSEIGEDLAAERAQQTAALRQRLRARWNKQAKASIDDDMEDWAVVEDDVDRRELQVLSEAHSRFCGEAVGICGAAASSSTETATTSTTTKAASSQMATMARLVDSHEDAMRDLSKRIATDHRRRRAALLAQVRKRHEAKESRQQLGDEVASAFATLDDELAADRRSQLQAQIKAHQCEVLGALAGDTPKKPSSSSPSCKAQPDLRDMFLSLCDDETSAAEARRRHESSCAQRQRTRIERRLAHRRAHHRYAPASPVEDDQVTDDQGSLVAQIQQARRRQIMTHQLHTKREQDLQGVQVTS